MSEEEVIISIKSCINSTKGGVFLSSINHDYKDLMGENIPYLKLGYSSLRSFICSIPDVLVSKTAAGEELLSCCGGKSAHIANLVSRQKSSSKPSRKKPAKFVALPRHFRDSAQSSKLQTRYAYSTKDLRFVGTHEQKFDKRSKLAYHNERDESSLPPRFRGKPEAVDVGQTKYSDRVTDEILGSTTSNKLNGFSSKSLEERVMPKRSKTNTSPVEDCRKSRLVHSETFLKRIADKGSGNKPKFNHFNGIGSSLSEDKLTDKAFHGSETIDPKSRLLRGPSAYASVTTDEDTVWPLSVGNNDGLTSKSLVITVTDNKRNVMCADNLQLSPDSSLPKHNNLYNVTDVYDGSPEFERYEETERPRALPSLIGYAVQDRDVSSALVEENGRLVGRVASLRRANTFSVMERLHSVRSVRHRSTDDDAITEALIRDFSSLRVSDSSFMAVEPALFHYLLIGDDFLLKLAHANLGAKVNRVGDRPVSCGLCCSGQSINSCFHDLKRFKLLSKVVLQLGAVDILEGSSVEAMKADMEALVDYLCTKVKVLAVLTVPPLPLASELDLWQNLMDFNAWLVGYVGKTYRNVRVLDVWELFEGPRGEICEELFEEESVPMYDRTKEVLLWNSEGRRQLVDYLRSALPRVTAEVNRS